MDNLFALKNFGIRPIINEFDSVSVATKRSFCEALLTTEDVSFVFNTDSLSKDIVKEYINKLLTRQNVVIFSVSNFTVPLIEKNLSDLWNTLDPQKRMNLGYLSRNFINQLFK